MWTHTQFKNETVEMRCGDTSIRVTIEDILFEGSNGKVQCKIEGVRGKPKATVVEKRGMVDLTEEVSIGAALCHPQGYSARMVYNAPKNYKYPYRDNN